MSATERDVFIAFFKGRSIVCDSVDDAVAVKTADEILAERTENEYTPREFAKLGEVLIRYGRDAEAEALTRYGSQRRAAKFLAKSVGHERPAHHVES